MHVHADPSTSMGIWSDGVMFLQKELARLTSSPATDGSTMILDSW